MEVGKVPTQVLKNLVIKPLQYIRNEVLLRPHVGEDCAALQLEQDEIFVMTADPITGASENVGKLAVHICCNDLASSGAEPIGIMVTLLLPEGTSEEILAKVMKEISSAAQDAKIDVLGGHTEVTSAVNKILLSVTAVGKVKKDLLVSTGGAVVGDDVILTKTAGLEGTAIIAVEKEEELIRILTKEALQRAQSFVNRISVVPEGMIGAQMRVHAMHDVTEGGVLGALWEVASASNTGIKVFEEKIPIAEETKKICNYYNIDPLKLISSGSMIIVAKNGEEVVQRLLESNIEACIVGKIVERDKQIIRQGKVFEIQDPESDELYKVV